MRKSAIQSDTARRGLALALLAASACWLASEAAAAQAANALKAARQAARQALNASGEKLACPDPTFEDVSYGPHERNLLDFWQAESDTPTPLVVFIHGGGFVNGSKNGIRGNPRAIIRCLENGVSFASISYPYRSNDYSLLSVLHDTARAIQFLKSKAGEWNLDKERFASYGGSAGAGSSLWIGYRPDLANPDNADPVLRESSRLAVIGANNCQCTYDIAQWPKIIGEYPGTPPEAATVGMAAAEGADAPEAQRERSELDMLGMLTPDDPPTFLYSAQPNVPPANRGHYVHHPKHAIAVKEKCDRLGIDAILITAENPAPEGKTPEDVMLEFFFKHLGV